MRKPILGRLTIIVLTATSFVTTATAKITSAAPVMGTISGTVTAGGVAVPAGSVQVVFVRYNKPGTPPSPYGGCTDGQPAAPVVNLIGVTVGSNGTYSQSLDTAYYWKIIFKPLTTAPRSAVFRWYTSALSSGTTVGWNINPAVVQASCITNLTSSGLSGINVAMSGTSVQLTGTIRTSSGAPTTNAAVQVVRTPTCYYQSPDGYASRPNDAGQWEIAGIDTNQTNQYLQVVSPPVNTSCQNASNVLYAKRINSGYSLVQASELAACSDLCKFNFGTSDISNVSLQLPVMGEITGVISGPSGPVGAGQVCVNAFKDGGTAMNYYSLQTGQACTDANGRYTIGLTFETYRLQFVSQLGSPYKSSWNGASMAEGYSASTPLCVKASGAGCSASQTINVTLAAGKSISGRVTDSSGPVSNATVHAMSVSTMGGYMGVGYARTDSDGNYTIYGLDDATYTLMFTHEDFGQQWFGGSRENGTTFALTANVIGKNMTLIRGSKLSGAMTTGDGSEARVCVSAYKVTDSNMGWGEYAAGSCFSAPGLWELKGIKDGTYRIRFEAQTGNLRSTFLGGSDYSDATLITVSGADVPNLAITIPTGKSISGRLSDVVKNEWISSGCVTAWLQKEGIMGYGNFAGSSCTDTQGKFNIRGLAEGRYKLQLNPPGNSDLTPGWYEELGAPVRNYTNASLIEISAGSPSETTTTPQSMQTGPKFTAVIVNSSSVAVQGICVDAIKVTNETYGWGEWGGNSCSGPDGKISLRGLTPGNYKFRVNANSGDYQNGWIDPSTSTTNTSQAAVSASPLGSDNVSLGNIRLSTGSKATGRIVSGGSPVAGACIGALKITAGNPWGEWSSSSCTQSNGQFAIRGLDPNATYKFRVDIWQGDYKPGFIADNGAIQNSPDGISGQNASTEILLGDIELPTAPSIKGTIFSGLSTKEANVCINAHLSTTYQWVSSSCSQQDGKYSLRGLDPGASYKISWWTQKPLLTNGWYKSVVSGATQAQNPIEADDLLVPTAGLTGIDIRIGSGGSITGTLTTGFCVAAWTSSSTAAGLDASLRENASSTACADSDGNYELKGLLPLTDYYVQVFKINGDPISSQTPNGDTAKRTGPTAVNISAS